VVLDAYLALVGAEQDLAFPDSGDLETDLQLVLGSLVDCLADPVVERRYRAPLTAIQDDAGLAGALLDRLLTPWLEATKQLDGPVYHRWLLRTDRSHRPTSMPWWR
jgi:hypothetical protein